MLEGLGKREQGGSLECRREDLTTMRVFVSEPEFPICPYTEIALHALTAHEPGWCGISVQAHSPAPELGHRKSQVTRARTNGSTPTDGSLGMKINYFMYY